MRRVIDADNSCLFNAVGYVMESGSRTSANRLRSRTRRAFTDPCKPQPVQRVEHITESGGRTCANRLRWERLFRV